MGEHPAGQLFRSAQWRHRGYHLLHDRSMDFHDVHDRVNVSICKDLAQIDHY
jgi:hypothetical protein